MSLYSKVLAKALQKAKERAESFCTSRQLRRELFTQVELDTPASASGFLRSPQYWAVYYQMGRRAMGIIRHKAAEYLVWFPNPKDDPRLVNGESPMHRSEVKSLRDVWGTGPEFNARMADARKAGKVVISKTSPTAGGSIRFEGNPYMKDEPGGGLYGMDRDINEIAAKEAYLEMENRLKASGLKKKTVTANIGLR
jgi:hypothetical protein